MHTSKPIREYRIDHIKHESSEVDRSLQIHVTDLSRCLTGVWQEKMGLAKPEVNESKLRRFDAGHTIESRVVEAIEHAGKLHSTQGRLDWPELNMTGSYDLILQEDDGQLWLVEVKSIHPYGMTHLYKSNKPHEHYLEQVNLYLSKLREEYPSIRAKLYYEALDGRTAEFEVEYDQSIVDAAMAKAEMLHEAIKLNERPEPPKEFVKENGKWSVNWRVKYCILNGVHLGCSTPLDPDPEKWVRKLEYKCKKLNKK